MYEEYLLDILKGYRKCDVRLYTTSKRGKIGIIKSKTNLLYGYVEFVSVELIEYEEYVCWHIGKNYSLIDAKMHIENNRKNPNKKYVRAYKYNFLNPVLLEYPVKIVPIKKNGSWIEFDDNVDIGYEQLNIFKINT